MVTALISSDVARGNKEAGCGRWANTITPVSFRMVQAEATQAVEDGPWEVLVRAGGR